MKSKKNPCKICLKLKMRQCPRAMASIPSTTLQTTAGSVADVTSLSSKSDVVNHPAHYTFGRFEVIDVIEDWKLPYHLGNSVKYIARQGRKDPAKTLEDLKKARWYLNRYITKLEKP